MPREIKTPVRYIMEDITPVKRPVLPTPPADLQPLKSKRGRPKSVSLDREPVTPSLSSRPSPRKSSESIIIPDDDDSDIEIIEPPKPSKRKKDDDPDWAVERKSKTSRSSRDRARREKPPTNISPPVSAATTPTATVASKGETPQKPFTVNLFMECREEPLSLAQLTAMKKEQAQYELSQSLVRAAREGRLIFLPDGGTKILDKPMVFAPPTPVIAAAPPIVAAPQSTPSSGLISQINLRNRSQSPDLLIIGETPPKMTPPVTLISPPVANVSKVTPANKVTAVNKVAAVNNVAPVNKAAPLSKVAPVNNVAPLSKVAPAPTAPPAGTLVQGTHGLGIRLPTGWQMVPVTTSATPAVKDATPAQAHTRNVGPKSVTSLRTKVQSEVLPPLRQVQQQQQQIQSRSDSEFQKKKLKKPALSEEDESGNWVPLDEYYYGKMEGNPTYQEAKGEHRFKCWYCNKMLYNNVAAMMHIQGHIDSERQVNLDLSDLTQCKHCYKQFDTPFEMQTHIEKVHMNNANVLLCRICERNHDSRQALKEHMRKSHNACEMPYICQLCKFRSSMYSDVVDHFKKKHNGSDAVLCMYCLRVFHVKFVSQGWGQTSIFYNHLMKHQVKNSCKKCQLCRLVFLNLGDVKMHRKMDHLSNQKGVIGMNAKYTTPDQVMIKVTEKTELSLAVGGVKSLNVPAVKKIMDHRLSFPPFVSRMKCIECQVFMGSPDHFRKFIQCSMCRFATSCSFAYSNHMMGFHSGQMTSAASHTPDESKLESKLYCSCGFVSNYGNRIANHLVFCSKSSCFKDPPAPCTADEFGHELQDPRKKPDASLLDVLGLIKKDSLAPLSARTPHLDSPPSEPVDMPEVPLSAKLGKKPLLLRDSLKKTFKSVFKSDKDKNIFERVKFGDDSLITEKQRDRVNLSSLKHDLKKVELPVSGEITTRVEGESQAKSGVEEKVTATETTGKDKTAIEGSNVSQQPNTAVKTSPMKLAKELDEILKDPCEKEKDSAVSASIEDCLLIGTDSDGNESNNTDKEVNNSLGNIVSQRQETVADVDLESHQVKDAGVEREPAKIDTGCDLVTDSVTESDSAKDDRTESDSTKDDRTESDSVKDDRTESDSTKDDRTESYSTKDDRTESDSTKDDRTESDSTKDDRTESDSTKDDRTESDSTKDDRTESDSTKDDRTESDSTKDDRTESDSTKDDRTESDSTKDDRTESDSTKDDRTESDSTKDDRTESDSTKDDRTESDSAKNSETAKNSANFENIDSAKNRDVECESDNDHSAESELTKTANADESTKTDDVESVLTKTDDVESELTKIYDIESESTKIGDVESESTKTDDTERKSVNIDDMESESTKISDMESNSTKIDVIESELTEIDYHESKSTKIDDLESESTKIDDTESESVKIDDMERESTKIDDFESESTKIYDTESESVKIDDMESESTKIDDTESESNKIGDTESESNKIDDLESESVKIDDMESESTKIDDMKSESNKIDDMESESIKIDDTESESVKIDDMESESNKIDYTKAVSTTVDFTESESTIIDDIESESTKIDDMESESRKIDDMESKSNKIGDMESESTNISDMENESTKIDYTKAVSTTFDFTESESTKIGDVENEATRIGDIESESATFGDMESESATFGDMESESATFGDMESESATFGDMESESATFGDMESESATIGDMESESTKTDHMESELTKDDDFESESTNNGIDRDVTDIDQPEYESFKNDVVESESVKNDDVESESFKNYYVESESIKNDDVESESIKNDDVESESIKNDDVESESIKNDDVESESIKNDDVESESIKNDDVESESIKNDDTELAKEDDVEIEFTKNNDFENESAKDGDIGYVSPKSGDVEVGPSAKTDVTDIESATEDVSLEAVKNCDAEDELNHDAECETARHDAENVKDKDNSGGGNAVSTDSRVTSGVFEQDQHVQAHATEVGSSSPGLDKYEQDEQEHRSCIETETEITDIAEPKHDSAMLCETDVRDNVDCDNQSDTKVMINEASSADIVDEDIVGEDIVDNNAHSTPVLSGQAGVDDEEIADDEQGLSLGSGEGTALCTIRDKVSETDVPGSLIKDHDDCELDSVSKDLKPGDNNSLQSYQQEYQDQDNSPGNSELLKSLSDSHHGSEATSKPADFEDNLSQQESSRAEEPTFTSAGGDVGWVSSKESLFSSQSGMSQNSCVSQGNDRPQFPAASDRDEGVDRLGSSISSNQDQGREDESHHQVASPVADLKISTSEESLPPYPSQQPHQIQPGSSDLQREPSVSSSAPSHSRSDRSHQRRSRSRSQDRRRERRSKSRDRDQDRDRHRNRDRDRHRDRRSRSRDRDRLDDRDRYNRDRHRDRSREKDRHRDRSRERDRGRDWDRNRDRDYYRHKDDRR